MEGLNNLGKKPNPPSHFIETDTLAEYVQKSAYGELKMLPGVLSHM